MNEYLVAYGIKGTTMKAEDIVKANDKDEACDKFKQMCKNAGVVLDGFEHCDFMG